MTPLAVPRGRLYDFTLPEDLDTPAVIIDVVRMEQNIALMAGDLAHRGIAFRPHMKTAKSIEVAQRCMQAGAKGLTVATLEEAEVFALAGFQHIFVAYPVWPSSAKSDRLARIRSLTRLTVGVESSEAARALGKCAPGMSVLIEVDSHYGRTGIDAAQAGELAKTAEAAGLVPVGAFTHGGHGYLPGGARTAALDEVRALSTAAEAMAEAGYPPEVLSAGSTPTARHSAVAPVTEERPGTFVFGDRQQAELGSIESNQVALAVVTSVVSSRPGVLVLDAGAKTLSKDRPEWLRGYGTVLGHPDAVIESLSDHHAVVRCGGGPQPQVGTQVAVIPNHVCPVVNLASELLVVKDGSVIDTWPIDASRRNR